MKKTTKCMAGLLAMVLALTCLFGCGSKNTTTGSNSGDGVSTVTFWSPSPHSKTLYVKLANEFNESTGKEKGINFVYEIKESNMTQAIDLALAADQAPELFVGGNVEALASKGDIMAFDDVKGAEKLVARFEDRLVPFTNTYNGKTYTLPVSSTINGLIYNKDMFKAAGIVDENGEPTPPETWAQLREYAKQLTDASKREFGVVLPLKWSGWVGSDILAAGMPSLGRQGYDPTTGKFDYTAYKPIIETYLGIRDDGSMVPGAENIDNDPARARFAEGGIGMKISASYDVAVFNDQFPAKIDWGIAPLPVLDKDNKYKQAMSLGSSARINAKAVERVGDEKLLAVLEWMYGEEVISQAFKEGLNIPNDVNIVNSTDLSGAKKGWKEFADMIEISTAAPVEIKTDTTGLKTFSDVFINEIWTGEKTVDQALTDYTNDMNSRIDKYKEINPDYDPEPFIIKDWNIKR